MGALPGAALSFFRKFFRLFEFSGFCLAGRTVLRHVLLQYFCFARTATEGRGIVKRAGETDSVHAPEMKMYFTPDYCNEVE